MWPPNHKYKNVFVQGVTDPDGDPVTIVITGIFQDEALNGAGDGNTWGRNSCSGPRFFCEPGAPPRNVASPDAGRIPCTLDERSPLTCRCKEVPR